MSADDGEESREQAGKRRKVYTGKIGRRRRASRPFLHNSPRQGARHEHLLLTHASFKEKTRREEGAKSTKRIGTRASFRFFFKCSPRVLVFNALAFPHAGKALNRFFLGFSFTGTQDLDVPRRCKSKSGEWRRGKEERRAREGCTFFLSMLASSPVVAIAKTLSFPSPLSLSPPLKTHLARHARDERDLALVARLVIGHGREVLGGGLAHSHGCCFEVERS